MVISTQSNENSLSSHKYAIKRTRLLHVEKVVTDYYGIEFEKYSNYMAIKCKLRDCTASKTALFEPRLHTKAKATRESRLSLS